MRPCGHPSVHPWTVRSRIRFRPTHRCSPVIANTGSMLLPRLVPTTLEVLEVLVESASRKNAAMTTMEPAPRQIAVKVSPEGDKLITSGAHYLHMSS